MQATGWIKLHQNLKDMYNIEHSVVHPFYNVTFNGKAPKKTQKVRCVCQVNIYLRHSCDLCGVIHFYMSLIESAN